MKKILATVLGCALLATVVSGCGNSSVSASPTPGASAGNTAQPGGTEKENTPYTVKWKLRISEQAKMGEVQAAVNKILAEKLPNTSLEFNFIEAASYNDKVKLALSAGEKFDMMFTSSSFNYQNYLAMDALLPLTGLIDAYGADLYDIIPESLWEAVTVKGEIMAVPNYQIVARQTSAVVPKELVKKYGIDVNAIKTFEDLEPYFDKIQADTKGLTFGSSFGSTDMDWLLYCGLEVVGGTGIGAIRIDDAVPTVFNQYEDEEMLQNLKRSRNWYVKGYYNPDIIGSGKFEDVTKAGKVMAMMQCNTPTSYSTLLTRYGMDCDIIPLTEPYISTSSVLGTLTALSYTSENPERTMQFINLLDTDEELYNTVVYGIKDVNYRFVNDKNIEMLPDSGYTTNVSWMIGNTMLKYPLTSESATLVEDTENLNRTSKASPILGFNFDSSPVKTEVASISAVLENYTSGLNAGLFEDVEGTLKKLNAELKAAGMDTVIAEKQKQLDAWLASK